MSWGRNRGRVGMGRVKNLRKAGKRKVSHRRYEFESMKRFVLYCAKKENVKPLRWAEYYPYCYQVRLAKYLHRNRNKLLT